MPRSTNKASKAKRTGKCHVCGDTGHYARDCKERKTDSEEVVLQDTMKCHVCGEIGHYARECKDKKSDTVKVALKAIIGFGTRSNKKAQGWYLNCGSSEHVCYSRDMFVDYNPMKDHEVILDNKDHLDVAGIGTVVIRFDTDKVLTLSNVLHIPKISKCYVSVAKLDDLGYIMYVGGVGVITKSDEVIGLGYNVGDEVYRLSLMGDRPLGKMIASQHPSADYDPMIDNEVNLDNRDDDDVARIGMSVVEFTADKANDSGFIVTFGGGQCVVKQGDVVVHKGHKEDLLYTMDCMKEPSPLAKVVHRETIGLLFGSEHPELTKARARGWYVLARCTMHVCNSRDMFVDYQPATGHEVFLEDDSRVAVVGYGTVKLQLTTGKVLTLKRVFHMPAVVKCCISVKKLKKMGFSLGFDAEGCYVKKGDQIVGNGFVQDGLFRLDVIDERSGGNQS
ncbi:copia-like retrotransposon [Tanacetum coccineum]